MKSTRRIFILTLIILLAVFGCSIVSVFYCLFTGTSAFGGAAFIMPYAAVGLSLIIVTSLWPAVRFFDEALIYASGFTAGILAFIGFELLFEKIPALSAERILDNYSAQAYLRLSPVLEFYPNGAPELFSPVARLHYYTISIILILIFIKAIFELLISTEFKKRLDRAYFVRLIAGAALLLVCVIGSISNFFRNGSRDLPLLSAMLTVSLFIIQSVSAGLFAAGLLKENYYIPPLVSLFACALAYIGEYFMLGGYFYRLGQGAFFSGALSAGERLNSSLAPADFAVILISGLLSFALCYALKPFKRTGLYYNFGRNLKWK